MRVILPGGVRVDWSPDEVAEAMRILTQSMLDAAKGLESPGLVLADRFLRHEDNSVRLTATEASIARFVLSRKCPDVEQVCTAVWGNDDKSDSGVRSHCSRISTKLFDAGIPFALRCEGGGVYFEEISAVPELGQP